MPNVSIRKKKENGFYGYSTINHDYNLKTISGNKVVVDNATGLMWHQSGPNNQMYVDAVKEWIQKLNESGYAGYRDWRMPTVEEAVSLMESSKKDGLYIDPIFCKQQRWIQTGDETLDSFGEGAGDDPLVVDFRNGGVFRDAYNAFSHSNYIRPVRSVE